MAKKDLPTSNPPERVGFEIDGRFYPAPERFRALDPLLIHELTGMDFIDFSEALQDPERRRDPILNVGVIGVAVWQGNPRWTREKIIRFMQNLDMDDIEPISPEGDAEEGANAGPPDEAAAE